METLVTVLFLCLLVYIGIEIGVILESRKKLEEERSNYIKLLEKEIEELRK